MRFAVLGSITNSINCFPSDTIRMRSAARPASAIRGRISGTSVSDDVLREVALSSLRRWRAEPASGRSALATVIASEWLQQMGELTTELEEPVTRAVEAAHLPWWQ